MLLILTPFVVSCAGHDVPDHDVVITSDCNGPTRSGRFHFDAFDFDTQCSGGILSGSCTSNIGHGILTEGDLEIESLELTGWSHAGPFRYELTMPPTISTTSYQNYIWCGWYVNDDLELTTTAKQDCYFATAGCWAQLDIQK